MSKEKIYIFDTTLRDGAQSSNKQITNRTNSGLFYQPFTPTEQII